MPRRLGPRDAAVTSRMMSRVRGKDSKAELALRRELHRRGVRFRLHGRDIEGRPDLVWRGKRVAVFVDGDMWHGNPAEITRRGHTELADLFPSRTEWWVSKIEGTRARDLAVTRSLTEKGWTILRLWESEVLANPSHAAERVMALLNLSEGYP